MHSRCSGKASSDHCVKRRGRPRRTSGKRDGPFLKVIPLPSLFFLFAPKKIELLLGATGTRPAGVEATHFHCNSMCLLSRTSSIRPRQHKFHNFENLLY